MKIQVYIVTGFLGAGKTTLVKRILSFPTDLSKTIVLVNEFGEVGIDKALIQRDTAAQIVELTSGCICCSLKTEMIQSLQILRYDYSPERIVIEATGVADPLNIIQALEDRFLSPYFSLNKTITVLDCDLWEAREAFGTVFKSQLQQADILLVNKIDTLDSSRISLILKEIQTQAPQARLIPTLHCNIEPDIFWSGGHGPDRGGKTPLFKPYDPEKDGFSLLEGAMTAKQAGFVSFSFNTLRQLDEALFTEFLESLPLELFRIKGAVRFANETRMLNFVGGKAEWQPWPGNTPTSLALIGWDVIEEQIVEKLNGVQI